MVASISRARRRLAASIAASTRRSSPSASCTRAASSRSSAVQEVQESDGHDCDVESHAHLSSPLPCSGTNTEKVASHGSPARDPIARSGEGPRHAGSASTR